jgi:hypothetical protein
VQKGGNVGPQELGKLTLEGASHPRRPQQPEAQPLCFYERRLGSPTHRFRATLAQRTAATVARTMPCESNHPFHCAGSPEAPASGGATEI